MKIKDITPKVEKTYSIEFSENELKNLALIVGTVSPNSYDNLFKDEEGYRLEQTNYPKPIKDFPTDFYTYLYYFIQKNK